MKIYFQNQSRFAQRIPLAWLLCALLSSPFLGIKGGFSQVTIGDSLKTAHPSAELEVFSESKGFLPPRMTTAQRDSIASPADGLIVYDTDLNKLLYYHNTWKGFGLWSTRDSTSGNIYYNSGKVAIGPGSDSTEMKATLNITGTKGIHASIYTDHSSKVPAYDFRDTLYNTGNFTGDITANVAVQTFSMGPPSDISVGMFSYYQGNANFGIAMGGMIYYDGAGGTGLDDMPGVAGVYSNTQVDNSSAYVFCVGTGNLSGSDHKGVNIGMSGQAYSDSVYANIGSIAVAGEREHTHVVDDIRDSIPARFTAAAVLYNDTSAAQDYNLFAFGDAQNYFGGNVGIGTFEPAHKLDINGAVNASAYLLNGDTLGDGVWSRSGDDIIYDEGKVKIGKPFPAPYASDLSVRGNVVFTSDSAKEGYLGSYFALDVDSVWSGRWESDSINTDRHFLLLGVNDTIASDTVHAGMAMGSFDEGMITWWGCGESFDDEAQRIFIVKTPTQSGIQISSHENNNAASQIFQAGEIRSAVTNSSDTVTTLLKTTGFGINTESPDTELHVNGNIKQSITTSNVSNPPTDGELDTLFTSPASKGDGWTAYVKDTNSDNLYQIMAVGTEWYIIGTTKAQ